MVRPGVTLCVAIATWWASSLHSQDLTLQTLIRRASITAWGGQGVFHFQHTAGPISVDVSSTRLQFSPWSTNRPRQLGFGLTADLDPLRCTIFLPHWAFVLSCTVALGLCVAQPPRRLSWSLADWAILCVAIAGTLSCVLLGQSALLLLSLIILTLLSLGHSLTRRTKLGRSPVPDEFPQ